jgi:hypothetical protein
VGAELGFAKETAKVLPKGVRRARVVGVVTSEVRQTFNESGRLQGLSHSLNRGLTIHDLAANASGEDGEKLRTLISSLNTLHPGLGDQLAASNLHSNFTLQQQIYLGAFEYGLTPRLSIGARLPVIKRSARNRFEAVTINNAGEIQKLVGSGLSPEMAAGLAKLDQSLDTPFYLQSIFTAKGYEAPRDFEKTQIGDLELGGKYNFYRDDTFHSTVLLGMGVPTGAKSDIRNIFDKGTSKETWCFGAQLFQEAEVLRRLTLGAAAKYSVSLPDSRERAVPKDEKDSLPSLQPEAGQVQTVKRTRGSQLETEVSAGYRFSGDKVGIWSAYQYSRKARDRFSGPGPLYYEGLAKNTDWALHAGEIGADYSTIPAFRKGTFSVPLEVSLLYNRPLRGRNTPDAAYTRLDFMVYF